MKIYGDLYQAQLQNNAGALTGAVSGRVYYNTTSHKAVLDDGTIHRAFLANDQYCVFGNNGTAASNIRLNRAAAGVLQLVTGDDVTAEGTLSTALAQLSFKHETYATGSIPAAGVAGRMVYDSTLNTLKVDNGVGWQLLGSSSGGGGINLLTGTDIDAEISIGNWVTYADAAATVPVDGLNGSPSSTFARSTSTPLAGSASFLWTKSANNRQGEGFSIPFTARTCDQAKVINISFDYTVVSGTYANNDMITYLYDVTNSLLIEPSGKNILGGTAGLPLRQISTFQTSSNSTSYRFIVHTSSVSALAYSMRFDNFLIGPQTFSYAAPDTDWISYSPTWGNITSSGAGAASSGKWRRVGDSMEIQAAINLGASGSVTGAIELPIPSGYTIDSSKFPATGSTFNTCIGGIQGLNGAGSLFVNGVPEWESTFTNKVRFVSTGTAGNYWQAGQPITWTASSQISATVVVPITGWSSTCLMSSDSDTRVVAARYKTTGAANIATATDTFLDFTTKVFDTHNAVTGNGGGNVTTTNTGWRYVVPVAGFYEVKASVGWASTTNWAVGTKNNQMSLYKTGAFYTSMVVDVNHTATAQEVYVQGSCIVQCVAGDYLELDMYQTSGSNLATIASGNTNWIEIKRLSGPSAIAASESVCALYTGAPPTGGPTSGVTSITTFGTKVKDSHNAYSSGTYTVPVSGTFSIEAAIDGGGTWALNQYAIAYIYVNGVVKYGGTSKAGGAVTEFFAYVNVHSVPLLAGDLVTIRYLTNCTSPTYIADATANYFSIVRTGNY